MNAPVLAPPRLAPQARFHRTARIGRAFVLAGALVFALNALATWCFPDYAARIMDSVAHVRILGPMTARTRLLYVLWDIPSLGIVLMALLRVWQLFGEYLRSRIFGAQALASLQSFARWVLAAAFASPVYRAVLSVLVTLQNGPGRREFTLDLSSADYLTLLLGIVVLAVSSVMAEAARIAEDNEGFV